MLNNCLWMVMLLMQGRELKRGDFIKEKLPVHNFQIPVDVYSLQIPIDVYNFQIPIEGNLI